MIINWIEVRDPDPDQEEPYTEYFVGATTEERVRHSGFLDVNETNPSSVSLKVYSNGHWADSLTGHVHFSHPEHPEHRCGIDALSDLIACVLEIRGLPEEEARKKLWGRTIQPIVTDALKLPVRDPPPEASPGHE